MKVTVEELKPELSPLKVTIEMGREEAFELKEILGSFGLNCNFPIKTGSTGTWESSIPAVRLSEEERKADKIFSGHPWKYKRVIDLLSNKLTDALNKVR